jgi:uncharacterized cupin superfamily protein
LAPAAVGWLHLVEDQVDFDPTRLRFVMSRALIETGNVAVTLTPRPIEPSWIIEGKPDARSFVLSKSADGTASTIVWECSEGKFNWYYDFDETILILEGSIVLESDTMPPTRYGPGDTIFLRTAPMPDGMSRVGYESWRSAARPNRFGSVLGCGCSSSSRKS